MPFIDHFSPDDMRRIREFIVKTAQLDASMLVLGPGQFCERHYSFDATLRGVTSSKDPLYSCDMPGTTIESIIERAKDIQEDRWEQEGQ